MPRSSLPSALKNIKSCEVLLTQTTEEDLWTMLLSKYKVFETLKDSYVTCASNQFGELLDGNPYDHVTKIEERLNTPTWVQENNCDQYFSFSILLRDLILCAKNLEWDQKPEFLDMQYELEKFNTMMASYQKDIEGLENIYYTKWVTKRKEERQEKERIDRLNNPHKYHQSIHSWEELFASKDFIPEAYRKDSLERYEISKNCSQCQEIEAKRTQIDKLEDDIAEIKKVVHTINKPYIAEKFECKDCEFETHVKSLHYSHMHSTEHRKILKLKEWFCEKCNSQSRTQTEWDNHIQTNKHLNKSDSNEYVCEKCEYKTKLKHLYDQHCNTKKHLN